METGLTIQTHQNEVMSVIEQSDNMYLSVLAAMGLPTDGVLSSIKERKSAIRNLPDIIEGLRDLDDAYYLSKFLVAVSTGLFDAALNYLWDETIKQLRIRVLSGDIKYFYDVVIPDVKRKDFTSPEDLLKLDDATLIEGALKIDLVSQIGFKHLDYVRYMRNWTSAAHPNQAELTGLNLVSWLETCIKEVIATPVSNVQIRISQLLRNIKAHSIDSSEAETISAFFTELSEEKANALAKGLFGIYIDSSSAQQTITNINLIAPHLWQFVSEAVRADFGTRCATFVANGEQHSKEASKRFLELVGGLPYLPDSIKTPQIRLAIDNLMDAHNSFNNFYNEPSIARQLKSIVGTHGSVPTQLNYAYIKTLITVFLTNGNGVAWSAEPIYIELIKNFDAKQSYLALTSFRDDIIKSKLQFRLCKEKYGELLNLIRSNITSEGVLSLLDEVKKSINSLSSITSTSKLTQKVQAFDKNIVRIQF
jgi:hypothetical protein